MSEVIESLRAKCIRLLDDYVYRDVIGDLDILDKIQPGATSNTCAVPTAMLILAALDFLGFRLHPEGHTNHSQSNITAALKYRDIFTEEYRTHAEVLAIAYRHGLMHTVYPKKHKAANVVYGVHKSDDNLLFN